MTGTVACSFSAAFSPSPPRGMIRSTTPSWVASWRSSSRSPPDTSEIAAGGMPTDATADGRHLGEDGVGVSRRGRAAKHDRVAGLQAQGGAVDRHVGPRLVDHGHHAERHPHPPYVEAVGQPVALDRLAHGIGQARRSCGRRWRSPPAAPRRGAAGRAAPGRDRPRCPPPCRARWPRGSPPRGPRGRRPWRAAPRPSWRCRGPRERAMRPARRGRRPLTEVAVAAMGQSLPAGLKELSRGRNSRGARPPRRRGA